MAVFAQYSDAERCSRCGRPLVCTAYTGSGGGGKTPFEEIEANYDGPCECAECAGKEIVMEPIVMGPKDTLRLLRGESSGQDLVVYAERQEAHRIATRYKDDGLGSYAEGYQKYLDRHPGARARLARTAQGIEDLLKKQGTGKGYSFETEGGMTVHVSGDPPEPEEQPDPDDDGDVVTIVERGGVRYGRVAAQDYQKKPGLAGAKTADQAKKELWRRAQELSKMSPADGMLMAVLENPQLVEILQKAREE